MKRDAELRRLILWQVREGQKPPELANYPEPEVVYNAALLIDEGCIRGRAVKGSSGEYITVVLQDLTSKGHDLLEQLESAKTTSRAGTSNQTNMKPANKQISIFVSHSAKDATIAEALIVLLRAALNIAANKIRCTSVVPYKLPAGADTDETLRAEIHGSEVFIGLVTPNSIASAYVLFELGARWGANLPLFPVIVGGKAELLKGPLTGLNALNCADSREVFQLVSDVGSALSITPGGPHTYANEAEALVKLAKNDLLAAVAEELVTMPDVESGQHQQKPQAPVFDDNERNTIRCLACWPHGGGDEELAAVQNLSMARIKHHLSRLQVNGLAGSGSYAPGIGNEWSLTEKGNTFAVENGLDSGAPARPPRGRSVRIRAL